MRIKHFTKPWLMAALLTVFLTAGCDSFLDVNENPNAPENARVDLRLPAIIAGFVHSVYYGDTQLWGAEWTQNFSYNRDTRSYAEVHRYELQDNDGTHAWNYYFSSVIKEAKLIQDETTADADAAYHGIAKFIFAWSFAHVTDMWGPVPFNEAFDTRIREPKYDDQKTVYAAVHKLLEEAIADMGRTGARLPGANDLLFSGDMARWIKLARHVQARHHLRLAYAPGESPTDRAQKALTALQQGLTSNADDVEFDYPGGDNARNPLYTFQDLIQFTASEFVVELLKGRNDPRLPILVAPAAWDSVRGTGVNQVIYRPSSPTYRGHRNGEPQETDSTLSRIGPRFSNEDAPLNLASYADAKFTEAEARLIVSGAAAADATYRDGIRANMQKLGVATAAINAYLAARPALTAANALEEIITEKYIANYLKVESWNDWRRTGFPNLEIVQGAVLPGIPQRIRTPGSELTNNVNAVKATGIPTGLEGMSVKVWWAEQGPR
ncbi:MAG: SusD/RagB family nutrient-binding outer membrane lipoprotein [Gemmatimonadota bacterium]